MSVEFGSPEAAAIVAASKRSELRLDARRKLEQRRRSLAKEVSLEEIVRYEAALVIDGKTFIASSSDFHDGEEGACRDVVDQALDWLASKESQAIAPLVTLPLIVAASAPETIATLP